MRQLFRFRCLLAVLLAAIPLASLAQTATNRGVGVEAVLGTDAAVPTYHALIIGINDYEHWVDLREARQDAEQVAKLLQSDYGFTYVRTLYDRAATRQNLIAALRKLTGELGPEDALLLYFSGHGHYDKLVNKGYWIPTEARETVNGDPAVAEWFDNTTLREYIGAMKTRHVLVVSDSCFSGALFRGGPVDLSAKENAWYRRAIASPSRWCITSGDLETVPDASVFARKFLMALQYPEQTVFSASDLAGWIKKEVATSSGRQPVFGPLKDDGGSAQGEFVFLRRVAKALTASKPTPPDVPSAPAMVTLFGSLLVKAKSAMTVQVDNGTPATLEAGKALRWDRMSVGRHTVRVSAEGQNKDYAVEVRENAEAELLAELEGLFAEAAEAHKAGEVMTLDLGGGVTMEFCWIPAGEFMMGSDDGADDERPVHRVRITQGFWIGKYEVTQEEYELVMGNNPSAHKSGRKPANKVSWNDAMEYCTKLEHISGKHARLPTEAEWEYACRAGTTTRFYNGNSSSGLSRIAVAPKKGISFSALKGPQSVGEKEPNAWGLYDTLGNVWEWCSDWYGPYTALVGTENPQGASSGNARVSRGGSFLHESGAARCAARLASPPAGADASSGFRVCVGEVR